MLADSLKNAFGLNCTVDPVKLKGLPLYMTSGRKLYKVSLGEASFLLVELPESDSFGVVALNKQMAVYYEKSGMDVAFGFESLSRIQRDALTSKGIPFISIPDQIYLLGAEYLNPFKMKKTGTYYSDIIYQLFGFSKYNAVGLYSSGTLSMFFSNIS